MKKAFLKKWFTILYLINFLNSQHKMNTNNFVFEICLEGKKKEDIVIEDFKHMYRLDQELLKIAMDNNDTNEINDKNE